MRRTVLLIAVTAAIGLLAGIAVAEAPDNADRERKLRHVRKQMAELERHRDELVDKKKLKEDDPRVREVAEQLERFERELHALEGREPRREHHEGERAEAERERQIDRLRGQLEKLERRREELVEKKGLKEDDPRVKELDEQAEGLEEKLEVLEPASQEDEHEAEIDRIHEEIEELERRREELVEEKDLEEDDPKVRQIDEQIDRLEAELMELEGEEHERRPVVRGAGDHRPPSPELLDRLEEELPKLQFEEDHLRTVIDILRERHKINIYVDWPQLEAAGVDEESLVTIAPLTDVPFETALRLILRSTTDEPDQLGFYVDGNVLIITRGELLPRPSRGPFPVEEVLERLRHERPEVHERLMVLRREHPEQFERELAGIAGPMPRPPREREEAELEELRRRDPERFELKKRDDELTDRTVELAEEIRRAKEGEARGKMKDELRKLLNTQFEVRMQIRKLEIREIKKHLDELLAGLDRRVRNKASLIERRMNQLLNPEETEW